MVKPGKGQAFNRVKVRNLKTGRVIERTFKSGDSVEAADVVETEMQYLYTDGEFWHFMVPDTFEQYTAGKEAVVGEGAIWLKDGTICIVMLWNGVPLNVTPPAHVELKVVETDPGVRGDTATGGRKPAKLETGAVVRVPLFINEGEVIRVDTRTGEYMSPREAVGVRLAAASRGIAFSSISATTCSRPADPRASKRANFGLSTSSTPMQLVRRASAARRSPNSTPQSHAMWPANSCTFGTTTVARRAAAVPHTPLPSAMRTHAGLPWNGPTTSSPSFSR